MRRQPVLGLILAMVAVAPAFAGLATIRDDDMRRHVAFLAADELAGRETGEPSIAIAERYVATAFASYGLEPLPGQDEFTVPFALYRRGFSVGHLDSGQLFHRRQILLGPYFNPDPSAFGVFRSPIDDRQDRVGKRIGMSSFDSFLSQREANQEVFAAWRQV